MLCFCIVTRGAVSARVWEVSVFRHADAVRIRIRIRIILFRKYKCKWCNKNELKYIM